MPIIIRLIFTIAYNEQVPHCGPVRLQRGMQTNDNFTNYELVWRGVCVYSDNSMKFSRADSVLFGSTYSPRLPLVKTR